MFINPTLLVLTAILMNSSVAMGQQVMVKRVDANLATHAFSLDSCYWRLTRVCPGSKEVGSLVRLGDKINGIPVRYISCEYERETVPGFNTKYMAIAGTYNCLAGPKQTSSGADRPAVVMIGVPAAAISR